MTPEPMRLTREEYEALAQSVLDKIGLGVLVPLDHVAEIKLAVNHVEITYTEDGDLKRWTRYIRP